MAEQDLRDLLEKADKVKAELDKSIAALEKLEKQYEDKKTPEEKL